MADRSSQLQPLQGTLSKEVERLTNSIINEISNLDNVSINEYLLMATTDPIVGAGIEVPMLMGALKLGEFTHEVPDIQSWVRQNFVNMQGSLQLSFAEMWQAKPFGHSWSPGERLSSSSCVTLPPVPCSSKAFHSSEYRR